MITSQKEFLKDMMVTFSFEWEVEHNVRTHGWFLVVADCALEQFNAHVPPMDYIIELYNEGFVHLPVRYNVIYLLQS